MESNLLHPLNKLFIFFKLLKLGFDILGKDSKDDHPSKRDFILLT